MAEWLHDGVMWQWPEGLWAVARWPEGLWAAVGWKFLLLAFVVGKYDIADREEEHEVTRAQVRVLYVVEGYGTLELM